MNIPCQACGGRLHHKDGCDIAKLEEKLRTGACRFNCRTQRAMFLIGYREAIANMEFGGEVNCTAEEAYDEWCEENDMQARD